MDLVVNHAGHEVFPAGINHFHTFSRLYRACDLRDTFAFDQHIGVANDPFVDQPCIRYK